MRILHCSDIHTYLPPSLLRLRGKRWAGAANWIFHRRHLHDLTQWKIFAEQVLADPPALLIHTGDLSQLGQADELKRSAEELYRFQDAGIRVLLVPGNHDRYQHDTTAEPILQRLLADFGGDHDETDGVSVLHFQGLEVILLAQSVPRGWFSSGGEMEASQWRALERLAARTRTESDRENAPRHRIVAGHFPLCDALGEPLSRKRRLLDAPRLRLLLRDLAADLYLCGHIHTPFITPLHDGCQQLCAGSLTAAGSYHDITLHRDHFTVEARQLLEESTT
ncbi:MAG: metallophosphoesterase family protein [Planctomycetota bacterium]|jgi:3',5'-cyclic AMP phosphodiesterase CpdA